MGYDFGTDLEFALKSVKSAGCYIRDNCYCLHFHLKSDKSPVTPVDIEVQEIMEGILSETGHHFMGEESQDPSLDVDDLLNSHDLCWCADPVDGTRSLINGENTVSTSLALLQFGSNTPELAQVGSSLEGNSALLGVVYNPFTDELFYGAKGFETKYKGVSGVDLVLVKQDVPSLSGAVCNYQVSRGNTDVANTMLDLWDDRKIAKLVSHGGSIAYNLAQVAKGSHGVYVVCSNKPYALWDIAAGVYLVESVGGVVGMYDEKTLIAARSQELYDEFVDAFSSVRR